MVWLPLDTTDVVCRRNVPIEQLCYGAIGLRPEKIPFVVSGWADELGLVIRQRELQRAVAQVGDGESSDQRLLVVFADLSYKRRPAEIDGILERVKYP